MRFTFKPAEIANRDLIRGWFEKDHVKEWFDGDGLEHTLQDLDAFFRGTSFFAHWLAWEKSHPFGYLLTSTVRKPHDELTYWCSLEGETITLDLLIGEEAYLGKGLSHIMVQEFLLSTFPSVQEVLLEPEIINTRAIRAYQKAGFRIIGNADAKEHCEPSYMMKLQMDELVDIVVET